MGGLVGSAFQLLSVSCRSGSGVDCSRQVNTSLVTHAAFTRLTTRLAPCCSHRTNREHRCEDGSTLCGSRRGSRAGRFRQSRLRRVPAHGTACPRSGQTGAPRQARASILVAARPQPARQGARSQGSRAMSWMWCARRGGRVDQVGEVGSVMPVDRAVVV